MEKGENKNADGSNAGVSQPIRYGKDYEMFCKFRRRVHQGGHPCIIGNDYVVMARSHYDEIIKAAQAGG
jgi:hypothetical protein